VLCRWWERRCEVALRWNQGHRSTGSYVIMMSRTAAAPTVNVVPRCQQITIILTSIPCDRRFQTARSACGRVREWFQLPYRLRLWGSMTNWADFSGVVRAYFDELMIDRVTDIGVPTHSKSCNATCGMFGRASGTFYASFQPVKAHCFLREWRTSR
jgi:hypothetical protein